MTAIQRTAYPRFRRLISTHELRNQFTPTADERHFLQATARSVQHRLNLAVILKSFQFLGYFPRLQVVPASVVQHLSFVLGLDESLRLRYDSQRTFQQHQEYVRTYLKVIGAGAQRRHIIAVAVYEAAQVMDTPADLITVAIEALRKAQCELPAFSPLDRAVLHVRAMVNRGLFQRLLDQLTLTEQQQLDALLIVDPATKRSPFVRLKLQPKQPTRTQLNRFEQHLRWLESLGDLDRLLGHLSPSKIVHCAGEARTLDAAALGSYSPRRRMALLACLVQQTRVHARDDLVEMLLKYVRAMHTDAKKALQDLRDRQQELIEGLLATLAALAEATESAADVTTLGTDVQAVFARVGGAERILTDCAALSVYNGDNYLPLLPAEYRPCRATLFRVLAVLQLVATTEDDGLMAALDLLRSLRSKQARYIPASVSLAFASEQWQRAVQVRRGKRKKKLVFDRCMFELCIFSELVDALRCGDVAVVGSEKFADYREQLLPWQECEALLTDYCRDLGIASTAQGFVFQLWIGLRCVATEVDEGYPNQTELVIGEDGVPVLKKFPTRETPPEFPAFEAAVLEAMPERSILEALRNTAYWTDWPAHLGPPSGAEPKLRDALAKYILTVFCYGCNIGPAQLERHLNKGISAQTFSMINQQHVSIRTLEAVRREIINTFNRLAIPAFWGDATVAGVDGTHYDLAEENLVAEFSFRYRTSGGIAYHHISDRYIALFVHFITCGTWEAIYLIDGLLKNTSDIQPTTIHGDTQAQSTIVFALTYLLGIDLMPRIRNWKGLIFFRPSKEIRYQHLEPLFGEAINWQLIETHWQDMMQVVLSIHKGKLLPSTLLRKLNNDSKRNKLYKAFRELGRVPRTVFLLRYISILELRQQVHQTTNKVESYHEFSGWSFFGDGGDIETNDPVEQEKSMHYKDIIADAMILQNTVDLTSVLKQLQADGYPVTRTLISLLSPYMTRNHRRYGEFAVDIEAEPEPIDPTFTLPEEARG